MSAININQISNVNTTDLELVELAGYHAYQYPVKQENIEINGKLFKVIDTDYDGKSGLDALTVKNTETNEITVVFVGSDQLSEDWLLTNSKLVGDVTPQQLKGAEDYFKYVNEMLDL